MIRQELVRKIRRFSKMLGLHHHPCVKTLVDGVIECGSIEVLHKACRSIAETRREQLQKRLREEQNWRAHAERGRRALEPYDKSIADIRAELCELAAYLEAAA